MQPFGDPVSALVCVKPRDNKSLQLQSVAGGLTKKVRIRL